MREEGQSAYAELSIEGVGMGYPVRDGEVLTPDKVMGAAITGVMAVMAGCS